MENLNRIVKIYNKDNNSESVFIVLDNEKEIQVTASQWPQTEREKREYLNDFIVDLPKYSSMGVMITQAQIDEIESKLR